MIDRSSRDRLAEALRHLLSGQLGNLAFDDLDGPGGVTHSDDPALLETFYAVWPAYDDFRSHPLRLTDGQSLDFKRFILFLHSGAEFEWPRRRLGVVDWFWRVADDITGQRFAWWPVTADGDMAVWPFFRRDDYDSALRSPRLLRGKVEHGFSARSTVPVSRSEAPDRRDLDSLPVSGSCGVG